MKVNRRHFLKLAGVIGVGVAVKPVIDVLSAVEAQKDVGEVETHIGKRLAMVVNPGASKDEFRACIAACHRVHNVPDMKDSDDEIKWIWTTDYEGAFPEQGHEFIEEYLKHMPFPVLCNHCSNPPCVKVCPTRSTWKREDGIVMMDYHRCIGCRFCMAACPYGARSFNWRDPRPFIEDITPDYPTRTKGVVEKCNFCAERLAEGLIPACVEACQQNGSDALVFGDLNDPNSRVRELLATHYAIQRKPGLGTEPKVYYLL
jgi:molybdopterin-containing oxidoreductase family iron-sulfur binding subunit